MRKETVLAQARFDERLQLYWMLQVLVTLAATFVGLPLVPLWLIFGKRVHRRQYECLECELTDRFLHIRKGFLFRIEKSIPLDKIQDVALKEGPILRRLGLVSLAVETAGQSAPQGSSDATLVGVVDAKDFRDQVLTQRDRVVGSSAPSSAAHAASASTTHDVLVEVRDSLHRIEELLARREPPAP